MSRMITVICRRELVSYFATPIALIFLTVFLVLNGLFTFKIQGFFEQGQADLRGFFVWHTWLYLFIVPAISMRLWAEERRSGSIELLLTLPVTIAEAMIGKFLAAWLFIGLALLLTFPMVITVLYLGNPDLGAIFAGYLGSFLMAGAFLAIGICVSAATSNQVISFVVATTISLVFVLLGFQPVIDIVGSILPGNLGSELVNLSFPYHFEGIQRGVITFSDIIYFVSLICFGLAAGVVIVDRKKAD